MLGTLSDREVLVIHSSPSELNIITVLLKNNGYHAIGTQRIAEGLELAEQQAPHLVILETEYALYFLEQRRKSSLLAMIPVLITVSAQTEKRMRHLALSMGANDWVETPIAASNILRVVHKTLKEHDFPALKLSEEKAPRARASLQGNITEINESGFVLETNIKIRPNIALHLNTPLKEELGIEDCHLLTTPVPRHQQRPRRKYAIHVTPLGLSEPRVKRIRELIQEWKLK